jgi:hypothetical protein
MAQASSQRCHSKVSAKASNAVVTMKASFNEAGKASFNEAGVMDYPFPGMNPYLENPDLWPEVHHLLISLLAETLNSCRPIESPLKSESINSVVRMPY